MEKNRCTSLMRLAVFSSTALLCFITGALAKPTTPEEAKTIVINWLHSETKPMNTALGGQVIRVQTFSAAHAGPAYHVVFLHPAGLVFVPADDLVEPIIGFVKDATSYDPSLSGPLGALVSRDIPGRVLKAREMEGMAAPEAVFPAPGSPWHTARHKWERLSSPGSSAQSSNGLPNISDIRIDPLVQSQWSQGGADGSYYPTSHPCYNYYTPPRAPGDPYNYWCGCSATAMAQVMRYWQYPTAGVGTTSFSITVDGDATTRSLRGGDGKGGPYQWVDMALTTSSSTPAAQCQAIGGLTADIGVSVNMSYSENSSAAFALPSAFMGTFQYSNAIEASGYPDEIPLANLYSMVNPNLDARHPAILDIYDTQDVGHAFVCDGYGYIGSTMYHHINVGWQGLDDAWYNLPSVDVTGYAFNSVYVSTYNIFVHGTGEIISGRVTDSKGNPISGASVTGTLSGGVTYSATTNGRGIYALVAVPSASSYNVSVAKEGYTFTQQTVSTGTSTDQTTTTGNMWGVNFVSSTGPTVTHFSVSAPSSAATGTAFNFTVTALDVNNQTVTGYSGTVHFTSTDKAANLPANAALTNGTGPFSATLNTAGSQTITATDTASSTTGTSNTITVSSAQTGSRYILWSGTGGQVSIWTLDNSNNYLGNKVYGPLSGWSPITFTRKPADGTGRLLWSSTGGAASIWTLDNSNNYLSSKVYGPYSGWTPLTYASNPSDGTGRLIWAGTGGSVSIWKLDASDNYISSAVYGPYSGWKPTTYVFNPTSGTGRLVWAGTGGAASIWKLDGSDNYVSSQVFGPFSGWSPVAFTFNSANGTSILTWASTAGQASIWKFDSSENYLGNYVYGPYSGWTPLTCGFNSADGTARPIWSGTGGMASIWSLDSSGNYLGSTVFGPFSGWMPLVYW